MTKITYILQTGFFYITNGHKKKMFYVIASIGRYNNRIFTKNKKLITSREAMRTDKYQYVFKHKRELIKLCKQLGIKFYKRYDR